MSEFPVRELAEALRPYVRPRDEVTWIRRVLQSHVQSQLNFDGRPLSSTDLHIGRHVSDLDAPTSLTGVRKAYWKALRAHQTAQARYEALKADLEHISKEHSSEAPSECSFSTEYLPILRPREKLRKLQVLDHSFTALSALYTAPSMISVDEIVRQRVGQQPFPPSTDILGSQRNSDMDMRMMQLKKAVLSTKYRIDARVSDGANGLAPGNAAASPMAEVAGLQQALNDLAGWMEQQLTLIGEAVAKLQSDADNPLAKDEQLSSPPASTTDIEALYKRYLSDRSRLIQAINEPPKQAFDIPSKTDTDIVPKNSADKRITTSEALLPYIPTLVAAEQHEQSLLQQTSYLRNQIFSAEAETARLMARLAEESHLVQPGASSGKDWAAAATWASKATENSVRERLRAGDNAAEAAKQALVAIQTIPNTLDVLREPRR